MLTWQSFRQTNPNVQKDECAQAKYGQRCTGLWCYYAEGDSFGAEEACKISPTPLGGPMLQRSVLCVCMASFIFWNCNKISRKNQMAIQTIHYCDLLLKQIEEEHIKISYLSQWTWEGFQLPIGSTIEMEKRKNPHIQAFAHRLVLIEIDFKEHNLRVFFGCSTELAYITNSYI